MTSVTVRAITPDEWELWRPIRQAALAEAPYAFASTLGQWSGDRDTERRWRQRLEYAAIDLVAFLDGEPAGMVGVTPPHDGDAELISMWVAPFARGRGVGDALIDAVVAWAEGEGLRTIALHVRVGNEAAAALYERHGFVDLGQATQPGDPHPERRMRRALG